MSTGHNITRTETWNGIRIEMLATIDQLTGTINWAVLIFAAHDAERLEARGEAHAVRLADAAGVAAIQGIATAAAVRAEVRRQMKANRR